MSILKKEEKTEDQTNANPGDGKGAESAGNSKDQGEKGKEKDLDDVSSLPEWAQKSIKDLRSENAQHRTKNNSLSTRLDQIESGFKTMFGEQGKELTPEEKIHALASEKENLEIRSSMLEIAMANGIGQDNFEYFEFLMKKKFDSMKDDDELSEDQLAEIVGKCQVQNGQQKGNTSPKTTQKGSNNPGNSGSDELDVAAFSKMTIIEKSKLFQEKPELYNKLLGEAKNKGVF